MSLTGRDNGNTPYRDVPLERRWTTEPASTVNVDCDKLIAFSESRAGNGPVRDQATRNFGLEVAQELADGRNYLVWWIAQVLAHNDGSDWVGDITAEIGQAMAHLVQAYERVERARGLQRDWGIVPA